MRVLKIAGAAIAAVLVVIVLLLVVGIPTGFVSATISEHVERATGYRLTVAGTTRISLWPRLNLTLSDITLQDPKERDGTNRITIGSVQANMPLSSAWSGKPVISELIITKPVFYVPLLRNREEILNRQMGDLLQRNREVPAVELSLQRLQRDERLEFWFTSCVVSSGGGS